MLSQIRHQNQSLARITSRKYQVVLVYEYELNDEKRSTGSKKDYPITNQL